MEEAITHKKATEMKRFEVPQNIQKLIKFVEWAVKRGGDALNDASAKDQALLTEEEKEMRKPFWTRTYFVGKQEYRFDRKFIDEYMSKANVMVKDNESAYHDYKKRALFPKMSEPSQAHMQQSKNKGDGKEMGFVEYQESKIIELHNVFVQICK